MLGSNAHAQEGHTAAVPADNPLADLSLEDLLSIRVTSASKKNQRLADTASAVFVISQDDIRRSGATSIPETLRMVPGLEVARIGSSKWAISSRGFNGRYANKLLVLVDGRSVYTPLFSGVWWESIDTAMEDIERIEVIRGPGAALWGANAVNGVINIITKNARDTQGGMVSAIAGSQERGNLTVRYGGQIQDGTYYRLYGKGFDRAPSHDALHDATTQDGWRSKRAGFRVDHYAGRDQFSFQGEDFRSSSGDTTTFDPGFLVSQTNTGGHLMGRWEHKLAENSSLVVQGYFDRTQVTIFNFEEHRDTYDLDVQHRFAPSNSQDIIWGFNYRKSRSQAINGLTEVLQPALLRTTLFSLFVQDDITLDPEHWRLTLGSKFEHHTYTGLETQPNVRLLWTPDPYSSWWIAGSRAVRTPSRLDADGTTTVYSSGTTSGILVGTNTFQSEVLTAYEIGYRSQLTPSFSADIAGFYNRYSGLRSLLPGTPIVLPFQTIYPYTAVNAGQARITGLELALDWRAQPWWRLRGAYTWLNTLSSSENVPLAFEQTTHDLLSPAPDNTSPHAQWSLRSSMDLSANVEVDLTLRHVSPLSALGIPGYTTMDARLGWKVQRDLELALVGQNLLQMRHTEFRSDLTPSTVTDVPASVYVKALWRF